MERNDKSTSRERLPAWFTAVAWSFIGILTAILTIFILTISLLWLLRWAGQAAPLTGPGSSQTIVTAENGTPGAEGAASAQDSTAAAQAPTDSLTSPALSQTPGSTGAAAAGET